MSTQELLFEPFRLDISNARLWRGDEPLTLTPKAFDVLAFLVTNPGRLITKEELMSRVWRDVVVTDASLVVCVREIRKALQDNARDPAIIETVHRRGYRFIAKVSEPAGPDLQQPGHGPRSAEAQIRPIPRVRSHSASIMPRSQLVGRDSELAQLRRMLAQVRAGDRQIVFVSGEPGSGKTSLVEAFLEEISQEHLWIAGGRCVEHFGGSEAYRPVLEAITQLCEQPQAVRLVELLKERSPTWLAQIPALQIHLEPAKSQPQLLGTTAARMQREIADALELLTADIPLIVALEDLHWSDYSTLDLLSHLANHQQFAQLMILATYRPVEVILSNHPLKPLKQELLSRGRCSEIAVGSLSRDAVGQLMRRRFPESLVVETTVDEIYRRTDGHPLFVVNLADYLDARGSLSGDHSIGQTTDDATESLPDSIRAMIEKQLDRLSEDERRLLETASVAGVEFSAAALATLMKTDLLAVEDKLDALARRRLFVAANGVLHWPDGTVSAEYRFLHTLYYEALYGRTPAARRIRYHHRLAELLETSYGDQAGELASELASHWERAEDPARAVHYLRVAGERASRRHANREATDYLTRAIQLAEQGAVKSEEMLELLEQRGLVRRACNDIDQAAGDFESMAALAQRLTNPDQEAKAHFYLASVYSWIDRERCLSAAEQAVFVSSKLKNELQRSHLRGWAAYWNLLWRSWRPEDADACAAAVSAARASNNLDLLCLHVTRLSCFQFLRSDYRDACQSAREGMELAVEIGDASEYLLARVFYVWALLHAGDWGTLTEAACDGLQVADINGHRRYAVLFRLHTALLYLEALDYEQALEAGKQALDESEEMGFPYGQLVSPIVLGHAYLGMGRPAEALQRFRSIQLRMASNRMLMDWIWRMPLYEGLSESYLALEQLDEARNEATALLTIAERPPNLCYSALAHRLLALIDRGDGHQETAWQHLNSAVAIVEAGDLPTASWRVHDTVAAFEQAQGDDASAAQSRLRAQETLKTMAGGLDSELPLRQELLDRIRARW